MFKEKNRYINSPFCPFPWEQILIRKDGNAYTCCWSDYVLGNVHKNSILELWNGERMQTLRESIVNGSGEECAEWCPIVRSKRVKSKKSSLGLKETERKLWWFENLTEEVPARQEVDEYRKEYHRNLDLQKTELEKRKVALKSKPSILRVSFSETCNARCVMCRNSFKLNDSGSEFKKSFFDELKDLYPYLTAFVLSEGEPLFQRDYMKTYKEIVDNGYSCKPFIETNGTLLNDMWIEYIIRHFSDIRVSVNAADEDTYMKIMRFKNENYFNRVLSNVEKLVSAKKRYKANCEIMLSMVVMDVNYRQMPEFLLIGERLGVDRIVFTPVCPTSGLKHTGLFSFEEKSKNLKILAEIDEILKHVEKQNTKAFLDIGNLKNAVWEMLNC